MNIDFDINNMDELSKRGFSIDQVILLIWIQRGIDLDIPSKGNKLQALYQSLVRKNLIDKDKLTTLGEDLLIYFRTKDISKLAKKKAVEKKVVAPSDEFNEWWSCYPRNDTFDHKGMHFEGDRGIRVNPDMCRAKFAAILEEGDYTAQNLIDALKIDVMKRKEASVRERTNKLKYLQNSLTYLNQRSYNTYIEEAKAGITSTNTQTTFDGVNL